MKLVREGINFERGLDPKRSLDVGLRRTENLKNFIEGGIENAAAEFIPEFCLKRDDGSKSWVTFYPEGAYGSKNPSVTIRKNSESIWEKTYEKRFKDAVNKWFSDNGYTVLKFENDTRYNVFEVDFEESV